MVITLQTFGDFLNFNSHHQLIATDACFKEEEFIKSQEVVGEDIEKAFREEVFRMLQKEGKMKISSFIEDEQMIRKILMELGLWMLDRRNNHDPPLESKTRNRV